MLVRPTTGDDRITGRSTSAYLVHLAIAGFGAETVAIEFTDLSRQEACSQASHCISKPLALMSSIASFGVALDNY